MDSWIHGFIYIYTFRDVTTANSLKAVFILEHIYSAEIKFISGKYYFI